MTTGRGISFNASLDISDVLSDFRRIEREAAQTARRVANVGRGAGGAAGRGVGGVGRTVAAGAGLGAGLAVFEQVFERIFELFEGTPVLETFTMAIDTLFKAFGPVVGVLLESLTPVIVALTPAIEPLARALIPLVEILGTNLLIAVNLLTPLITLAARGIEFLTTGLQTFINFGINFVIDQLNRLPFVDIQLEIGKTGDSFDAMSMQIAAAADESDEAEPKVKMLADGVMGAGDAAAAAATPLGVLQQRELEAASATELLRLSIVNNTDATSFQKQAQDAAAAAALELETALIAQGLAAGAGRQEADLLSLSMGAMREGFTSTSPEAATLAERIEAMTFKIMDAQTEAGLAEMAFAGLTPEMQMAAAELGLFGQSIMEVAGAAAAAVDDLTTAQGRFDAAQRAARNADGSRPPPGEGTDRRTRYVNGRPPDNSRDQGSGRIVSARRLGPNGNVLFYSTAEDPGTEYNADTFGRRAEVEAWLRANRPEPGGGMAAALSGGTGGGGGGVQVPITVNVRVGEEPVEAIVETNNQRNNLTGR